MYFREVFDSAEWNATIKALGGSIAQSWEWGLFHQRRRSVRQLITTCVYSLTRDGYARALASEEMKAIGEPVPDPLAPFIGSRSSQPPNVIAAYRHGAMEK